MIQLESFYRITIKHLPWHSYDQRTVHLINCNWIVQTSFFTKFIWYKHFEFEQEALPSGFDIITWGLAGWWYLQVDPDLMVEGQYSCTSIHHHYAHPVCATRANHSLWADGHAPPPPPRLTHWSSPQLTFDLAHLYPANVTRCWLATSMLVGILPTLNQQLLIAEYLLMSDSSIHHLAVKNVFMTTQILFRQEKTVSDVLH